MRYVNYAAYGLLSAAAAEQLLMLIGYGKAITMMAHAALYSAIAHLLSRLTY